MRLNKIGKYIIKNTKGITLIALVVTIIVLIILAGISISLILGNNGIINKSQEARINYQLAANEEQTKLDEIYGQLQIAADGTVTMDMTTLNEIIQNKINDSVGQTIGTLENTIQQMQKTITTLQSNQTPVGTIISVMATAEKKPAGYLVCDGTWYDVNGDYSELAEYIKNQFGSYDYFKLSGETTQANKFKVPDLRGEFLRGTGNNGHSGQGNGTTVGVHQNGTSHVFTQWGFSRPYVGANNSSDWVSPSSYDTYVMSSGSYFQICSQYGALSSDDSQAKFYTSRPTNTSVLYCIKY